MKLAIATPTYGNHEVAQGYFAYFNPLLQICKEVDVVDYRLLGHNDLVRARSRAVALTLARDYTHLLFWDADVGGEGSVSVLRGMIAEQRDFIAAPYARKRFKGEHGMTHNPNGYVGMGFTLLSRKCLDDMCKAYRETLQFNDRYDDADHPTVALFMLMMYTQKDGTRTLLSEDYSFCQRWKDIGGDVYLYTGPGLPLVHVGAYPYK